MVVDNLKASFYFLTSSKECSSFCFHCKLAIKINPSYSTYTPAQHWCIRWIQYLWLKTKTDVTRTGNTLSSHGTDCKASWTTITHGTWELDRGSCRVTIIVALPQKEQQMFRKASLSWRLKSVKLKTLKTTINLPEQSRSSYLLFSSTPPTPSPQDQKFKNQNFISN